MVRIRIRWCRLCPGASQVRPLLGDRPCRGPRSLVDSCRGRSQDAKLKGVYVGEPLMIRCSRRPWKHRFLPTGRSISTAVSASRSQLWTPRCLEGLPRPRTECSITMRRPELAPGLLLRAFWHLFGKVGRTHCLLTIRTHPLEHVYRETYKTIVNLRNSNMSVQDPAAKRQQ